MLLFSFFYLEGQYVFIIKIDHLDLRAFVGFFFFFIWYCYTLYIKLIHYFISDCNFSSRRKAHLLHIGLGSLTWGSKLPYTRCIFQNHYKNSLTSLSEDCYKFNILFRIHLIYYVIPVAVKIIKPFI